MANPIEDELETHFRPDGVKIRACRGRTFVSTFQLVDEIASGQPIKWGGIDIAGRKPFINAIDLDHGSRRPALEQAIHFMGALYAWGIGLPVESLLALEKTLEDVTREEVLTLTKDDPWIQNFALNVWEFVHGAIELQSYPWNVTLPIADICNARCTFCTSWIEGKALVSLKQIEKLAEVLRYAGQIGLVGHGEPLAHPQFDKICELIATYSDPRAATYTITNGVYLKKWAEKIDAIRLKSISVSLNAATARTHHEVMGLGEDAFNGIVDSLRQLCLPMADGKKRNVYITMVITQQNIHEIPAFIRLGEEIGVTQVWLRSLLPQTELAPGLNYHLLPPYLHPNFARLKDQALAAIQAAKVAVVADPQTWGTPIFSPTMQEKIDRSPPAIVSREQVLRDKTLRNRGEGLYNSETLARRGKPLPSKEFTRVEFAKEAVRVATPAAQWSYALTQNVRIPEGAHGAGRITANVEGVAGKLGIGLYDELAKEWVSRRTLEEDGQAVLEFPSTIKNLKLIVENHAPGGMKSEGTINTPKLHLEGRSEEVLPLALMTIHNPIDPYEDGLNPMGREPRFSCKAVYYNLYINEMYFRIVPCCYMTTVPGFEEIRFDGSAPFLDVWNSPAMVELRTKLKDGPLFGACKKCAASW